MNISPKYTKELYKKLSAIEDELEKKCFEQIKPLLDKGQFDNARQAVRDFYKPYKLDGDDILTGPFFVRTRIKQLEKKYI